MTLGPVLRGPATAGVAAAGLLVVGLWWWSASGDTAADLPTRVIAAAPAVRHDAPAAPAMRAPGTATWVATSRPAAEPAAADLAACQAPGCPVAPTPPLATTGEPPSPVDPDAWALHPEPGPVASLPRFEARVNTPQIPDEYDTTPEEDSAAGAEATPGPVE